MNLDIASILAEGRRIWGPRHTAQTLSSVLVRLGVSFGDLCRVARNADKDQTLGDAEVKKELGNIIVSTIRWCDDLGFDVNDCIAAAFRSQEAFAKTNKNR